MSDREYQLEYISLGAGVQSTTVALMAAHGEIDPMPDCAIFADTGAEPRAVYEHLDWLEGQLPFPVHRVNYGSLYEDIMNSKGPGSNVQGRAGGYVAAPFFTKDPDAILRRECTTNYKIFPINRKVKELIGKGEPGRRVRLKKGQGPIVRGWQGISYDEAHRMKPSPLPWIKVRYPLVEGKRRMTRGSCLDWMKHHGYPTPPRSACTFCPYHSNEEWRNLRDNDPEGWRQALEVDEHIRHMPENKVARLTCGTLYLHRDRVPLSEANIEDPKKDQIDLWGGECDGMCGF